MKDKFTVDLDKVASGLLPQRAYKLSDVQDRIERVAYDLVRFRDNQDTDQLWKIQESADGPVIVALYGDDGSLTTESKVKKDWEAIPDKNSMHIYYKGEPLVSLSAEQIGVPVSEFNIVRRWLPGKLAKDESFQTLLLQRVSVPVRKLIAQRFPELTKVASLPNEDGLEELTKIITAQTKETDLEAFAESIIQGKLYKNAMSTKILSRSEIEELSEILLNRASRMAVTQ